MTTDLAVYEPPTDREVEHWRRLAPLLANSKLVPERFQGKRDDILAVAFTAHAMGLPLTPYTLGRFYCPKPGTVAMDTQLYVTMAGRHGWDVWLEEQTAEKATACLQHGKDGRIHRYTFTMDDAAKAGLAAKDTYKKYPAVMISYKAISHLIRRVCPYVLFGIPGVEGGEPPTPGADPETGEVIDVEGEDVETAEEPTSADAEEHAAQGETLFDGGEPF